jgi:hypothetical protein
MSVPLPQALSAVSTTPPRFRLWSQLFASPSWTLKPTQPERSAFFTPRKPFSLFLTPGSKISRAHFSPLSSGP